MLKKLQKIIPYVTLTVLVFVFSTHMAHAQIGSSITKTIVDYTLGTIDNVVAAIFQLVLFIMHYWVTVTAALFSVSINLNLHIKQFVDSTTGVYTVWKTIRDVCSLFIIFMLLYAAIKLILSQEEKGLDGVGHLIKNIVIAGILINFSFFITSLLIDASNMVSLAIYKGIVSTDATIDAPTPGTNSDCITNSSASTPAVTCLAGNMLNPQKGVTPDASLADFFMTKLSPQEVYNLKLSNPQGTTVSPDANDSTPAPLRTLVQGVVGAVIMFTIGMSFLFASIAFAARLVILVILLAFSSIWFASWIFPELKSKSKEFTDILKGQLIFMPVYLLLLYGALVVLNNSSIFNSPSTAVTQANGWMFGYIVLAINDFFIIFLLNLPLVTAFSFASASTKWLGADRFNANAVWKSVGKNTGSFAWRNSGSIAASRINNSEGMRRFIANNPTAGKFVSGNVGKVAGRYNKYQEAQRKEAEKINKQIGTVDRASYDTDAEFKEAERVARDLQKTHRETLASSEVSILSKMIRTRGSKQAGYSLQNTANKKAKVKALKSNKVLKTKKEEELKDLEKEISRQEAGALLQPGKPATAEQIKRRKDLEEDITKLDKDISDGEEEAENEKIERTAEAVNRKSKNEGGGDKPKKEEPKKTE